MSAKLKPVPEPPGGNERTVAEQISAVQGALPLVPASEEDAVQRLLQRTFVANREAAGEWLTFLRALGLAREAGSGYVRERTDPEEIDLAAAFVEGVFGASDALNILEAADRPLDAGQVYDRFREKIPQWERNKRADWEDVWRERVRRLLDWAVLFDLAGEPEETDSGYRPA